MPKYCPNSKGVALLAVLATVLIVVILTTVILNIVSSQSRLTHHQVSRIQAYYAAMAGANYAREMLRSRADPVNWYVPTTPANSYIRYLCNGCAGAGNINEPNLAPSIQNVTIEVLSPGAGAPPCVPPLGIPVCIRSTANYTS